VLRSVFYSAVRCQACQQRQFRFNPWGVALVVGAVSLLAFIVSVIYVVSV